MQMVILPVILEAASIVLAACGHSNIREKLIGVLEGEQINHKIS